MRRYSNTRMDNIAGLRFAYDRARSLMLAQDAYCDAAAFGRWADIDGKPFPEDLQWEALVDVVRGRVKGESPYLCENKGELIQLTVHNHCYGTRSLCFQCQSGMTMTHFARDGRFG